MKIPRATSPNKRRLIISLAILLVAGLGGGAYALHRADSQSTQPSTSSSSTSTPPAPKNVDLNPPTSDEVQAGQDTKAQNLNASSSPSPSSQASSDLSVTAYNTGNTIQIRTTLQTVVSDGSCSVVLTNGSATVTQSAVGIQPLSDYSTCKGWNVPVSQLSTGTWTVKVSATYQSKTAIASTEVTIP